jgi:nucleotide-binding universal stress UspA family protein
VTIDYPEARMVKRYVVGIDGSSPSAAALRWATARANRENAPLVLTHVRDAEAGLMGEDFVREESRRSSELMAKLSAELGPTGLDVSIAILEGLVASALAEFATDLDVVVVGTHKTGFLHGRVLGSRSVQIASTVPGSVAVVPDADLRFRRGVVVGVDHRETAAPVALIAAAEAISGGDDLSIIQAELPPGQSRADLPLRLAETSVRDRFPALRVRARVSGRSAAEALLDAARDKRLLVLGPGSTAPSRSPIGSVIHDVLLNVNAPVLIVRPTAQAH